MYLLHIRIIKKPLFQNLFQTTFDYQYDIALIIVNAFEKYYHIMP